MSHKLWRAIPVLMMYLINSVIDTSAPFLSDSWLAIGRNCFMIFRPYRNWNSGVKGCSNLFRNADRIRSKGCRTQINFPKDNHKIKKLCQKWDSNPRLQSRLRPEHSALDHSAILTWYSVIFGQFGFWNLYTYEKWFIEKIVSEVGFEPTPTRVDCDLNAAP